MKLQDGAAALDAEFVVDSTSDRGGAFSIVLESRGGGRNSDYGRALESLLRAVGISNAEISCIEVDSPLARLLHPDDRKLPLRYPVRPDPGSDLSALRKEVSRLQIPIAQQPGAKGGNPTKRIRIHVEGTSLSASDFEAGVGPADGWLRRQAFLATWNPDVWGWAKRDADIRSTERGRQVPDRWSTGTRKSGIRPGDSILLLRQGRTDRGIVGVGVARGRGECVFEAGHFLEERASRGETAHYVGVSWQRLVADADRLEIDDLRAEFGEIDWDNIQSSGQRVPAWTADAIRREFLLRVGDGALGAPEIQDAKQAVDIAAGRTSAPKRHRLSAAQNTAIEVHAMALGRTHLRSLGWTEIADTSKGNPYDFLCRRPDGSTLHVEVKGTTCRGDAVVLTRREVELHNDRHPHNALLLVHGIALSGPARDQAHGGSVRFVHPWRIDPAALQVIGYTYSTAGLTE